MRRLLAAFVFLLIVDVTRFVAAQLPFRCVVPSTTTAAEGIFPNTDAFVGGIVWADQNGNGLQDADEPGIPGVSIMLYRENNTPTNCITTSNSSGFYLFRIYPPREGGNFYLDVDVDMIFEAGYAITRRTTTRLVSPEQDNDFNQVNGQTENMLLVRAPPPNTIDRDLGLIPIPQCYSRLDLMIGLDFSTSISGRNNEYDLMRYFARALVRAFQIGAAQTHIGLVQFNRRNLPSEWNSRVEIALNQHADRSVLMNSIRDYRLPAGINNRATSLYEGLRLSQQQIGQIGRPHTPHLIVLVTDADHNEPFFFGNPIVEATRIKNLGTSIFIVRLAAAPGRERATGNFVTQIASAPLADYVIEVGGKQSELISAILPLVPALCDEQSTTVARNYFTTSPITLSWSSVDWATQYEVRVSTDPSMQAAPVYTTVTAEPEVILPPLDDAVYCWHVRALWAEGAGDWSRSDCFIIDAVPG